MRVSVDHFPQFLKRLSVSGCGVGALKRWRRCIGITLGQAKVSPPGRNLSLGQSDTRADTRISTLLGNGFHIDILQEFGSFIQFVGAGQANREGVGTSSG